MSQRERVVAYCTEEMQKAWDEGRFEEAADYAYVLNGMEVLTDEQYDAAWADIIPV